MNIKRLWHSIRLYAMFNSKKRGDYVRQHQLFGHCGENVRLPQMLLPLHSEMIYLHNNVEIASGVRFVVHDAIHGVLNAKYGTEEFQEYIGRIEIKDNVFIGANSVILGDVTIGPDVVVGACSMINKSIPAGKVYGGVPAKEISTFEKLAEKRRQFKAK